LSTIFTNYKNNYGPVTKSDVTFPTPATFIVSAVGITRALHNQRRPEIYFHSEYRHWNVSWAPRE